MHYHASSPKNIEDTRKEWAVARRESRCLVLAPPLTEEESKALFSLLPGEPPKGAVLAVFTSGTVGNPKPVFHSVESLQASADQVTKWLKKEKGILSTLSPWSMAGFLFGVLVREKISVYSLSDSPIFASGEFVELVREGKITHLITHPYHLEIFTEREVWRELKDADLTVASFTAPLSAAVKKRVESFGIEVEIGYGLSEAAGPVLVNGKSLGADCKLSKEGELLLSGKQLMLGAEIPFATGDLFKKVRGRLEWKGRIRELIDVAGRKIAPNWVEGLVLEFAGVKDCFAYAVPDEVHGQRVALLIEGHGINEEKFQRFLEKTFSPDLLPREWKILPEFPRLPAGKKNRKRLTEAY